MKINIHVKYLVEGIIHAALPFVYGYLIMDNCSKHQIVWVIVLSIILLFNCYLLGKKILYVKSI